jgi:hypothetical protein
MFCRSSGRHHIFLFVFLYHYSLHMCFYFNCFCFLVDNVFCFHNNDTICSCSYYVTIIVNRILISVFYYHFNNTCLPISFVIIYWWNNVFLYLLSDISSDISSPCFVTILVSLAVVVVLLYCTSDTVISCSCYTLLSFWWHVCFSLCSFTTLLNRVWLFVFYYKSNDTVLSCLCSVIILATLISYSRVEV